MQVVIRQVPPSGKYIRFGYRCIQGQGKKGNGRHIGRTASRVVYLDGKHIHAIAQEGTEILNHKCLGFSARIKDGLMRRRGNGRVCRPVTHGSDIGTGNFNSVQIGNKAVIIVHVQNKSPDPGHIINRKCFADKNRIAIIQFGGIVLVTIPEARTTRLPAGIIKFIADPVMLNGVVIGRIFPFIPFPDDILPVKNVFTVLAGSKNQDMSLRG